MFLIEEYRRICFSAPDDVYRFKESEIIFGCEEQPNYYDVEEFIHEVRIPEIISKLRNRFGDGFVTYTEKSPDEEYPTFNVEMDQNSQGLIETRTYEYEVVEVACHKNIKEVL